MRAARLHEHGKPLAIDDVPGFGGHRHVAWGADTFPRMRLHFLVFAALRGTPLASLPYASKVTGLLEDLEIDTPPLDNIGIGQLIATIDRSWDTRAEILARTGRRLSGLKGQGKTDE